MSAINKIKINMTMIHQKIKTLVMLATVASLWLAVPGTLRAQDVLEKMSISATTYDQSTNSTDNGTTSTTKAPSKGSITTATLLKDLELVEGTTFPSGATLVFNGDGFEVDKGTNFSLDVSDALTYTISGQNDISTGSFSDANGPESAPFTQTDYYLVTVAYTGANYTFTVTGLATVTGKATAPNGKTGNYTQSGTIAVQDGTGEGTVTISGNSVPFVMTGFTMSASGSEAENSGTGTDEQ
jgi:hypothetical protein